MVRHDLSQDRETNGSVHCKIECPKLTIRFAKGGRTTFTDRDWLNFSWKRSNKTRLLQCQNSCQKLLYFRANQGVQDDKLSNQRCKATSSNLPIGSCLYSTEDVRSVWRPYWVLNTSQESEKVAKSDIMFFTPLDPWCTEEEEYCYDLTRPRKVHDKTEWKHPLKTLLTGFILGKHERKTTFIANEIACNHHKQHIPAWLYWTSHHKTRRNDYLPAIFNTKIYGTYCLEELGISSSSKLFQKRSEKLLARQSEAPIRNNATKEDSSFQIDLRVRGES